MNIKLTIPLIAAGILLLMGGYFLANPSYEKSIQAKYYFEMGEYDRALKLSREAFSMDVYNRMASTITAQSITSLKYVSYVQSGAKYMKSIDEIATHESISDADKAKIRLMCNIMIDAYVKLAPSVITDQELVQKAAKYHDGFEKLLEKVSN